MLPASGPRIPHPHLLQQLQRAVDAWRRTQQCTWGAPLSPHEERLQNFMMWRQNRSLKVDSSPSPHPNPRVWAACIVTGNGFYICPALPAWSMWSSPRVGRICYVTSIDFQVCDAAAKQIIWQVERESVCTWVTKQRTSISALGTENL